MSEEAQMEQAQELENDVEVTFDESGKKVNVQEEDDTLEVEATSEDSSEEELDSYSKGVQKRIKKLTEKYRFAERDKEEAARIAEVLKKENDQLKNKLNSLDQGYITEYGTRLESQKATAKQAYRDAHERGDPDAMYEASQALSKIAIEEERYRMAKQRQEAQAVQQPVQQQPVQQEVQQPAQQKPHPKAEKWAAKHEWFGEDEIMTNAAFVIDKQLLEEGFDGTSDEYYSELDARLRNRFPNEMGGTKNGGSSRVASASTSASRSNKQGRRTVKLSPSQVAMAKKLGVPLEEYAKYVKD
jgi:hypothetical protein